MMDFEATSLLPSAIWDGKSVCTKIGNGFAFESYMNDFYVKVFNIQTFNQDGNESAFSKRKYYIRRNLILQHLPVKEKVKKRG